MKSYRTFFPNKYIYVYTTVIEIRFAYVYFSFAVEVLKFDGQCNALAPSMPGNVTLHCKVRCQFVVLHTLPLHYYKKHTCVCVFVCVCVCVCVCLCLCTLSSDWIHTTKHLERCHDLEFCAQLCSFFVCLCSMY